MNSGNHVLQVGEIEIHPTAEICTGTIVGKPFRRFLDGTQELPQKTHIGEKVYIGYYSVIGAGSVIGPEVIVDDYCIIESRVMIGRHSLINYRAQICNDARIGEECVIGGFMGERTVVGNGCRVFGQIVHMQHNPSLGWDDDDAMETSAVIEDEAFVGFNALVIGGVTVGRKAYICAGAIVTKDVPDLHIVSGINHIVPFFEWRGRLSKSLFFGGS